MLALVLIALAQSTAPEPPATKVADPYEECTCTADHKIVETEFVGLVQDARLSLAPGGLSVLPRQRTVFKVISSKDRSIKDTVEIWHETKPQDCGITFNYGKRYRVPLRRVKGGLETDYCLTPEKIN
ncbi:MAG: hypothetical protein AAF720_03810 [Pseudomonadota bacterium]